jgi:hypothetical protein
MTMTGEGGCIVARQLTGMLSAVGLIAVILSRATSAAVAEPVLKWMHGGCASTWCNRAWYSSPAVADLNNDGEPEVVAATYALDILGGADGHVIKAFNHGGSRTWPGVVVADINKDGHPEIVSVNYGNVEVRNGQGDTIWTRQPAAAELRGVAVADLDGNGTLQVVTTAAQADSTNTWVYSASGALRAGWPQRSGTGGYSWGVYNDNAAIGNIAGDTLPEIIVPSDVHYLCAYDRNGLAVQASSFFGTKTWGQVGVWADTAPEHRGWGGCDGTPVESYRPNFATGAAVIADVDNNGVAEVVLTGNVYDCSDAANASKYTGVFLFNADRTRFKHGSFDWTIPPAGSAAPISEDYNVIESCMPDPAVADIDGDGNKEILFSAYDGKVHAFSLDKTEHDHWPFSVYHAGDAYLQFASPPVIADLDNDGKAEVIFTTWTQVLSNRTGSLYVLDYKGDVLWQVALPDTFGGANWNGAMASPTIDRIDTSGNLSVVINTAASGVVAYGLPNTKNARILWGTGRANYRRDGNVPVPGAAAVYNPRVHAAAGDAGRGSVCVDLGGVATRICVPFDPAKGFSANLFGANGRRLPCRRDGATITSPSRSGGLFILRMRGPDGRSEVAARLFR